MQAASLKKTIGPARDGAAVVAPGLGVACRFIKRTFDIVASLAGLPVLSPVLLATALAVYSST